jgi:hypothetical protein
MACKTCGLAALLMPTRCAKRRLQCCAGPVDHSQDTTTVQGDLTGRCHTADRAQQDRATGLDSPHAVEGIISLLLALNALAAVIGIQLPWGHLSDPVSQCNCPILSYKRIGQTTDSNKALLGKFNPRLEQQYTLCGHRVLCSGGPNHINPHVHRAFSIARTRET